MVTCMTDDREAVRSVGYPSNSLASCYPVVTFMTSRGCDVDRDGQCSPKKVRTVGVIKTNFRPICPQTQAQVRCWTGV